MCNAACKAASLWATCIQIQIHKCKYKDAKKQIQLQIQTQTHNCKYTWSKCGLESSPPLPLSWWGAPIDRRQKTNTRILIKEMHICKYTNTDQNVTDLSNISVWKSGKIRNFLFLCSQNKQIANSGGNSFIQISKLNSHEETLWKLHCWKNQGEQTIWSYT